MESYLVSTIVGALVAWAWITHQELVKLRRELEELRQQQTGHLPRS